MSILEVVKLWRYLGFNRFQCRTTLKGQLSFIAYTEDCIIFLPLTEVKALLPSWRVAYRQHAKQFNWETHQPEYEN